MSMKSKVDKEKERVAQEKAQNILTSMLRDEDNKYCVDCDSKGPRWASWNLGVFLCIRCAGIHRNLGVHISKVKSVNLDTWTPQQVASMQAMGNSKARAVYEANIPDDFRRPQTDSAVESFIRQKYEKKKFLAAEWVPTKPPDVPLGWDEVGPPDSKKVEFKKLQLPARSSGGTSPVNTSPRVEAKSVASTVPATLTVSLPPAATTTTTTSTIVTDLLGLSMGPASPAQQPPISVSSSSSQDLLGLNSEFSAFVSASPVSSISTAEATKTSQVDAATPSDGRLSKDSILALFGPKSGQGTVPPQPSMFGQFQSPGLPSVGQFQSPGANHTTMGQFQSPSVGLGQFQPPPGQFGQPQSSPNNLAFNPNMANGTKHSNLLNLYNQPPINTVNGFQQPPVNNPFLDTSQVPRSGQIPGLNTGSSSLWQ